MKLWVVVQPLTPALSPIIGGRGASPSESPINNESEDAIRGVLEQLEVQDLMSHLARPIVGTTRNIHFEAARSAIEPLPSVSPSEGAAGGLVSPALGAGSCTRLLRSVLMKSVVIVISISHNGVTSNISVMMLA